MPNAQIPKFIRRWQASGASERANYQLFLSELCDLLEVPRRDPAGPDNAENAYVFERPVTFHHGDGSTSGGRIDLYKRGCFVLEAKQGVEQASTPAPLSAAKQAAQARRRKGSAIRQTPAWDDSMLRARGQAEQYARALPTAEGRPPFLVVVDVGHTMELYSEFSRTGGNYIPFPDPRAHRISLKQLEDAAQREKLRAVWTDPLSLDPSRKSAQVTREIAERLAKLARRLEGAGHAPQAVAAFLMRCIFTMFAEDVGLLPQKRLVALLEERRRKPETFVPMIEELWSKMNSGGFSTALEEKVLRFNGGLFEDVTALPLDVDQLELLIEAAKADWREVEPAIFGTLLERALDPVERHKLGAHYTPRAYVERLVLPTVVEPLRLEWSAVQTAAVTLARAGDTDKALKEVQSFHRRLCEVRVLDPACGSGNFLYVTLEHLKRLEGEVLNTMQSLDDRQYLLEMQGFTVDPHQLLGIEVNPRAAAITELVLWIGYLQWHFRTRGEVTPPEPIIKNFHNIECRDAVLTWDRVEPMLDDKGKPVTRWDGRTTKTHPVTGEQVPDEAARAPVVQYIKPRKADWPAADYVVGNPPFLGVRYMREVLGDGYVDALRSANAEVPESADFVTYWWNKAADLVRKSSVEQFGLITTNSISRSFNKRVLEAYLAHDPPLSLVFVIPDHPWVDSADAAAVRIAMTVCKRGLLDGLMKQVTRETLSPQGEAQIETDTKIGRIDSSFSIGLNLSDVRSLESNSTITCLGVKLHGMGFVVTHEEARQLGLGTKRGLEKHIRHYLNGRDLMAQSRDAMVIDLFGLAEEEVQSKFPTLYQWVHDRVKPERDQNKRESYRDNWWVFAEPRSTLRPMLSSVRCYIGTCQTAKHRVFVFIDSNTLPDQKILAVALDDAFYIGVLSSRIHMAWTLATCSFLEDRPCYSQAACFDPFPFPLGSTERRQRVRTIGQRLDAHRKRQQGLHPTLTMTGMYNVLEKLRSGESLTAKEKIIHDQGLISVLRQIHDDLDAAVFEAYGWPATLTDEEILERLVALNAERAEEEKRGLIRWLRPEFQNPEGARAAAPREQMELEVPEETDGRGDDQRLGTRRDAASTQKAPWPADLAGQAQAVRAALAALPAPATPETLARQFTRANKARVGDLLETLASLGQARRLPDGRYIFQP